MLCIDTSHAQRDQNLDSDRKARNQNFDAITTTLPAQLVKLEEVKKSKVS